MFRVCGIFASVAISLASSSVEHDLGQWIAGLSLRLPNVTQTKSVWPLGNVSLTLSNFLCSEFAVNSLESSTASPSQSSRSVRLTLSGASAGSCHGQWGVHRHDRQVMNGSVSFRIAAVDAALPLKFDSADHVPISVESSCMTSLKLDRLHFTGDMGNLFNVFSGFLQGSLDHLVHWLGCRALHEALSPVNALIMKLLHRPVDPQPAIPTLSPAARSAHLVDWQHDSLMLSAIPDAAGGAADLRAIAERLSGGRDFVSFEVPASLPANLSLGSNFSKQLGLEVTVSLKNISLGGVGTVTECEIMGVAHDEPHSLRSRCAFDEVNLSASVALRISPLKASTHGLCSASTPLEIHITSALALQRVLFEMQVLIAADYHRVNKLTVDGLLYAATPTIALSTLAAALYSVNLTEFEARASTIKAASLLQDGGPLGVAIAASADNLISSFLGTPEFQNILPNTMDAYMFPMLRTQFNSRAASLLESMRPDAMSDGGAMKPHPTQGIDPAHNSWLVVLVACTFIPASLCIYSFVRYRMRKTPISPWQDVQGSPVLTSTKQSLAAMCSPTMQYAFPLLLVANMALGLWSILVPVCDVRVKAAGGFVDPLKPVANDSLLVYSFFQMLHDFWESGARIIAFLLLMGSLVLPQVCGWLSLIAFAFPMSSKIRGFWCWTHFIVIRLLFVNQCFICLVVCTLRSQLVLPGATIDIMAEPIDGLIGGTIGTLFGVANAGLLLYLQRSFAEDANANTLSGSPTADVADAQQSPAHQISRKKSALGTAGAVVTCTCLCGAFATETLTFTISGLGGIVESSKLSTMSNVKDVWLLSLPSTLYSSTDEHANALIIGSLFFLLAVLAPVLCCITWIVQWLSALISCTAPSASKSRVLRFIFAVSPYLFGWCATDIFWSAAAAGCLEMDLSVQFIVKHRAGALCSQIENQLGMPCVHVGGSLLAGGWWLLAFVIVSWAMFGFTTLALKSDVNSRDPETRVFPTSASSGGLPLVQTFQTAS